RHREVRPVHHSEQYERKECHQDDEQLQHLEIERFGLEQQTVDQRADRMIDDTPHVELADKFGSAGFSRDISDEVDIDHKQNDIGDVKLPQPFENAGCRHDETALQHHPSIEDRGRIAADKHEQISGAAESEIPHGQQTDRVVRDVIQEEKPGRETKQQIESEIAVARGELGLY